MYAVNVDGTEMTIEDEFELILMSLRMFYHKLRLKIFIKLNVLKKLHLNSILSPAKLKQQN